MGSGHQGEISAEWQGRVNRAIDHIRADPRRECSLAEIAAVAHSSPFHFHRIFTAVTGESPAAYARRCRLERAGHLMMAAPDRSLTEIALDCGFPALSDFSRSFRRHYGIAPSAWDRTTRIDRVEPAAVDQPLDHPDPVPEPRLIDLAPMRLAYVRVKGIIGIDDLRPGYQRLLDWAASVDLDLDRQRLVGMSWDNYETTPFDRIHYEFGLTIPADVDPGPAGEIGCRDLPAVTAVAVRCRGPLRSIAVAWDHLYERWFPSSNLVPVHLPALKMFHRRPDQIGWDRWDLDCAIAVTTG